MLAMDILIINNNKFNYINNKTIANHGESKKYAKRNKTQPATKLNDSIQLEDTKMHRDKQKKFVKPDINEINRTALKYKMLKKSYEDRQLDRDIHANALNNQPSTSTSCENAIDSTTMYDQTKGNKQYNE